MSAANYYSSSGGGEGGGGGGFDNNTTAADAHPSSIDRYDTVSPLDPRTGRPLASPYADSDNALPYHPSPVDNHPPPPPRNQYDDYDDGGGGGGGSRSPYGYQSQPYAPDNSSSFYASGGGNPYQPDAPPPHSDTAYRRPHPYPNLSTSSTNSSILGPALNQTPTSHSADPYADNIPLQTRRPVSHQHGIANADVDLAPRPHKTYMPTRAPRRPYFIWLISAIMVGVFIAQLVRNTQLTGSPIATKPTFNPMIGPAFSVQVVMGARYVLCMQPQPDLWTTPAPGGGTLEISFVCPGATTRDAACTLAEHCGFSGVPSTAEILADPENVGPNQWWRFITAIFLHSGLVHIGFNLLLQLTLGADMEKLIGPARLALVYLASGVFGNILSGNFAPRGMASVGASGALFGILALTILDLLYHWHERARPVRDLMLHIAEIAISFVLGLLPGLDNFAHIGGFVMGLMLGIVVLHSPARLRRRIGASGEPPYTPMMMSGGSGEETAPDGERKFTRAPVGFFKNRPTGWWVWWVVRAGSAAAAAVATIVLLRSFYVSRVECGWCKYLSCLPVRDWCEIGDFTVETTVEGQ